MRVKRTLARGSIEDHRANAAEEDAVLENQPQHANQRHWLQVSRSRRANRMHSNLRQEKGLSFRCRFPLSGYRPATPRTRGWQAVL